MGGHMTGRDSLMHRYKSLIDREPATPDEHLENVRIADALSRADAELADLKRAKVNLYSIPRDEHTRIQLRARALRRSLAQPRLACGSDECDEG